MAGRKHEQVEFSLKTSCKDICHRSLPLLSFAELSCKVVRLGENLQNDFSGNGVPALLNPKFHYDSVSVSNRRSN